MKILKLNERTIKKAADAILKGQVVVFPTDTIYGLVCDIGNRKAMSKLFKIKGRAKSKKAPVFVKDIKMAKRLCRIDRKQEEFLKEVWPGRVTVVLKNRKGGTLGLRIPKSDFVKKLVSAVNRPVSGTSANVSGKPGSGRISNVVRQFEGRKYRPDLVIDAGNLKKSRPSTVIDFTVTPPKILRP